MSRVRLLFALPLLLFCGLSAPAMGLAHFGMVLPSEQVVMDAAHNKVELQLKFWHPFENKGMDLARPKSFAVWHDGKATDLLLALKEAKEQGHSAWRVEYALARPGLYSFVMEPQPYWEEAEDCFIIHHTKAITSAFGEDEGWNEPLGLRTEIVPLVKPYALYAGNLFQGRVLLDGKPVPGAEVEVEWYPGPDLRGDAPNEMLITQTVLADADGVFSYVMPLEGWWGFAALNTAPETLQHQGKEKKVELGAVLWLRAHHAPRVDPLSKK